jgi:hypothetical protein
VSNELVVVGLLVLAGFFAGGAWSARKTSVPVTVGAALASVLALASAVLRLG